jgi:hypothetical protein
MPIYNQSTLENVAALNQGIRVDSAAALVTAAAVTKFTVSGGNVCMLGFYGMVMVDIAATATTVIVTHTPTVGTASILAILAGATDIQGFADGRMAYLASFGSILTWTATAYGIMNPAAGTRYILRPGALSIKGSDAPATGTVKWSMFYVPVDPGAYVTGS